MNDNIKAGAEIHAGDGGYSIGTQEKYEEFVKARNRRPDRIMELVRESHLDVYALGKDHEKWEATVKKFTELILVDVTDILTTYRGKIVFEDGAEYNYEHPIIAIRKHFGVKE